MSMLIYLLYNLLLVLCFFQTLKLNFDSLLLMCSTLCSFSLLGINAKLYYLQNSDTGVSFEVAKNKRHRFRLIHSGGSNKCPIKCSIDGHEVLIIALDGNAIEPIRANQFSFVAGNIGC